MSRMQRRMSTIREYKFFRSFSAKVDNWPLRKAEAIWRKMRERKIAGKRNTSMQTTLLWRDLADLLDTYHLNGCLAPPIARGEVEKEIVPYVLFGCPCCSADDLTRTTLRFFMCLMSGVGGCGINLSILSLSVYLHPEFASTHARSPLKTSSDESSFSVRRRKQ